MPPRAALVSIIPLLAAACSSNSQRFYFKPSPLEVLVQPDPSSEVVARVLVSVPEGVKGRRANGSRPEMVVLLRVENRTSDLLVFEVERALLVGSSLEEFGPPRSPEGKELLIPPGTTTPIDLFFPYPEGMSLRAPDLDGLNLQWILRRGEGRYETSVTLDRAVWIPDPYYGSYYGGSVFIGVGYGC